jgi:catechol 2,3-dioxygenase-like lactoylglutathione lyase family enzyme
MAEFPAPTAGFVATHFIVVSDVERSRRFYTEVLGGETVRSGEPCVGQLCRWANYAERLAKGRTGASRSGAGGHRLVSLALLAFTEGACPDAGAGRKVAASAGTRPTAEGGRELSWLRQRVAPAR